MNHLFKIRQLAVLMAVVCSLSASPIWAANPAELIPDSASVVVRWKSPQATINKLADYVDAVQEGMGGSLKAVGPALVVSNVLKLKDVQGIDLNSDIWGVIFIEPQQQPTMAFIVKAKDVDALKADLPDEAESEVTDGWVIFSDDEDALTEIKLRMEGKGEALAKQIPADALKLIGGSDLSVVVNLKALTEDFSTELDQAIPQMQAFFSQIADSMPAGQQAQMHAVFDAYGEIGAAGIKGLRDSDLLTLGLMISKSAIRLETIQTVKSGSDTSKSLAKQPGTDLPMLNKLPPNKGIYVDGKFDMSSFVEWSTNMSKSMLIDSTDEQKEQFEQAMKEFSKLKYDEITMYLDLAPTSPAFRSGSVTMVTPTKLMREISQKMSKCMAELKVPNMTQTMTLEPNVEKVGGFEVDRLTITQVFDDTADPLGMQKKMQKVLFGDMGMQTRMLYQPNRVFQSLGGSTAELQELLDYVEGKKSGTSAISTYRKRYFPKANLIALFDVARLAVSGLKLADQQKILPFDGSAIDSVKLTPSYVGFALNCEPTSIQTQLEVPVEQAQTIARIVQTLRPAP